MNSPTKFISAEQAVRLANERDRAAIRTLQDLQVDVRAGVVTTYKEAGDDYHAITRAIRLLEWRIQQNSEELQRHYAKQPRTYSENHD